MNHQILHSIGVFRKVLFYFLFFCIIRSRTDFGQSQSCMGLKLCYEYVFWVTFGVHFIEPVCIFVLGKLLPYSNVIFFGFVKDLCVAFCCFLFHRLPVDTFSISILYTVFFVYPLMCFLMVIPTVRIRAT